METSTQKTQYIFRISKGALDETDEEKLERLENTLKRIPEIAWKD
jgi:hypothetical protein